MGKGVKLNPSVRHVALSVSRPLDRFAVLHGDHVRRKRAHASQKSNAWCKQLENKCCAYKNPSLVMDCNSSVAVSTDYERTETEMSIVLDSGRSEGPWGIQHTSPQ